MPLAVFHNKLNGLSMMEILATVLIINFGILGLSKLQLSSYEIQANTILSLKAAFYTEALAQKLAENSALAKSTNSPYTLSSYTNTPTTTATTAVCVTQVCTASNLAVYDMNTWLYKIKTVFPKGKAKITKSALSNNNVIYSIMIQWQYKTQVKEYELLAEI